jgi:hypothetical protein
MPKQFVYFCVLLSVALMFAPGLSHARYYDPDLSQFLSIDPVFDFPENFGNAYSYAGQNPVNQTDPSGENAYVMTRKLNIWDGLVPRPLGEHVYLAFSDLNMGDSWKSTLSASGFKKTQILDDLKDTLNNRNYNTWITFSYHPTSVRYEKVKNQQINDMSGSPTTQGNIFYTCYTDGWDIIFNDYNADIAPIGSYNNPADPSIQSDFYTLTKDESEQVRLFKTCVYYYNHRNTNAYSDYSVWFSNCGTWAQDAVTSSDLKWPGGVNNGLGTGGMVDYTLFPQTMYAGSATIGETGRCLGATGHLLSQVGLYLGDSVQTGYNSLMP